MTAQIAGFISRAAWGARPPKSVSRNITPERGGVTKHYGGDGGPPSSHDGCIQRWKSWQNFHMDGRGWSDIAYTCGYCDHGYVFAGRGYGVRTAANGTNSGNQNWYAATWIGGGSGAPSQAALDALDWIVLDARANGGAGGGFNNHRDHKSTSCPGNFLSGYQLNAGGGGGTPPPVVAPPRPAPGNAPPFPLPAGWYFGPKSGPKHSVSGYYSYRNELRQWQQQMKNRGWNGIIVDGLYGPNTADHARSFQRDKGLGVDGLIGPATWAAAWNAPIT